MANLDFLGIKARNLKCFGDTFQGIDAISPMNIIIGRNNTGKTSLLDMIYFAKTAHADEDLYHKGIEPQALITVNVNETIRKSLLAHRSNDGAYVLKLNKAFTERTTAWLLNPGGKLQPKPDLGTVPMHETFATALYDDIHRIAHLPFQDMSIIRLAADRDIVPEIDQSFESPITDADLRPTGEGATRILARMLQRPNHNHRRLIETEVLDALNFIYEVDGTFDRIYALHDKLGGKETWEVYLAYGATTVALSKMGSGVKTVLLVLLAIHVMWH